MRHVNIVGGGIAGLSAAWELRGRGVPCTVFEASERVGGKLQTERHGGFLLESAADAFITQKPDAERLARELGLGDELISPRAENRKLYFLRGGELRRIPPAMKLIVPLEDEPFLRSGLMSEAGLRRFLAEQDVPARTGDRDESLADFTIRRFGPEALNFVAPLLGGIYVAKAHELSMQAAFPQYVAMERQHGSVIRGVRAAQQAAGQGEKPVFYALRGGMGQLVGALREGLAGCIRTNAEVIRVRPDGSVTLRGGETVAGDAALLATPSRVTRSLLGGQFPGADDLLGELRENGSVAVALAFDAAQVAFPLDTHGFLVDAAEGTPLTAVTLHSSKLAGRAPEGSVLLRAFLKGDDVLRQSPETLTELACREVRPLLGLSGPPLFSRVYNWAGGNPAYQLGHRERVAALQASLPDHLRVIGCSYGGVGIPDCVRLARGAAALVAPAPRPGDRTPPVMPHPASKGAAAHVPAHPGARR